MEDFISFFDEETILVNDPIFSREAICEYVEKLAKLGQKKRGQSKRYTTLATEVSSRHVDLQKTAECATVKMILKSVKEY